MGDLVTGEHQIRALRNQHADLPQPERDQRSARSAAQAAKVTALPKLEISTRSLPGVSQGPLIEPGVLTFKSDVTILHFGAIWCAPCTRGAGIVDAELQPAFAVNQVRFQPIYQILNPEDKNSVALQKLIRNSKHQFGLAEKLSGYVGADGDALPYWVAVHQTGRPLRIWNG